MADALKNFYYSLEDRYYAFLDGIDKHLPIYKVIDPIDKIVPSFAIFFLIGILVVLGLLFYLVSPLVAGPGVTLTFSIQQLDGTGIENANVILTYNGLSQSLQSDTTGSLPPISVSKGTLVKYEVTADNFDGKKGETTAETDAIVKVVLASAAPGTNEKTIRLLSGNNTLLLGEARVSFSCSNPSAVPPADRTTLNGIVTVTPPTNCGILLVSVRANGFENVDSQPYTTDIRLAELESAKGNVTASVTYNGTGVPGISVALYQNSAGPINERQTDATGNVSFTVSAGSAYTLQTRPTALYGQASSPSFSVTAGQNVSQSLQLAKDVKATLTISVKEENSSTKIQGAIVSVWQGNNQLDVQTSDDNGQVEFGLSDTGEYFVTADQKDYLIGKKTVVINSAGSFSETIELAKFSGDRAGQLTVEVLEQDSSRGVKNAKVFLYDADTNFLSGYAPQYTDINGLARFSNVEDGGRFYAAAFKEGSVGYSDTEKFLVREQESFKLQVSLKIPNGTIRVRVTDSESNPVDTAKVTIFDSFNDFKMGSSLTDSNGVFILPATNQYAKADKTVYVKVEHDQFASYTTVEKQILANSVQNFDVVLQPKIIQGNAAIVPLGLFQGTKSALSVAAGKKYTAKFQVQIPENQTYTGALVHLRVGKNDNGTGILEKDNSSISEINAPGTSIVKGTSFDPSAGRESDFQFLTAGNAKWANLEWNSLGPGIYEIEETFQVNKTASITDPVKLFFRFEGDLSGTHRDPTDNSTSDSLYAKTYERTYSIGTSAPLCDSDFCFDVSVLDQNTKLAESVSDSYNAHIFNDYKLSFGLANNSSYKIYSNAELRIENKDKGLNLQTYNVLDVSNQLFKGSFSDNALDLVNVGSLTKNNKVSGDVQFKTVKSGSAVLSFQVIADNSIVFSKDIIINAQAQNSFKVSVSPATLPAGIENTVDVNVFDATTGLEVENSFITLKNRFDEVLGNAKTDKLGAASLTAPAVYPGESLKLIVEKSDYAEKQIDLSADPNTLNFKPDTLSIALNARTKAQDSKTVEVSNNAAFPLTLSSVTYSGNSKNLLNEDQINSGLYSFQGITLQPGDKQTITLTSYLSTEGTLLSDREQLDGSLNINAANFGQTWAFNVPVKTTIGVGEEVDNENCLVITQTDWTTSTEGSVRQAEFQIQNNCTVNGIPVALDTLEAEADWQGNVIGTFLLSLYSDTSTAAVAAIEPRSSYFKTLAEQVPAGQTYNAILQFSPQGGVEGTAKADIVIRAHNQTDNAKDQLLSQTLKTSINIINLQSCISYSKELLTINKTSEQTNASTDFTISNRTGCGPIELFLTSDLELSNSELTLADGGTSPSIVVGAGSNWPGQYNITVEAQPQGVTQKSEITSLIEKNHFIRVRLYNTDDCVQLDRYEYDVYKDQSSPDTTGFDTGELKNNCYKKDVKIQIDTKSFFNALKEGLKWGLVTLAAGMLVQELEGDSTSNAPNSTPTATQSYSVKNVNDTTIQVTSADGLYSITYTKDASGNYKPSSSYDSDFLKNTLKNANLPTTISAEQAKTSVTAKFVLSPTGNAIASPTGGAISDIFKNTGALGWLGNLLIPGGSGFLGGAFGSQPWSQALGVTLLTAMNAYFNSEVLDYTVSRIDLDVNEFIVLRDKTADEIQDSDVHVEEVGQRTVASSTTSGQEVQKIGLQFFNDSDFNGTLYKIFKVDGGRHTYKENKTYNINDVASSGLFSTPSVSDIDVDGLELEEDTNSPKYALFRFHLQFNAISPEETISPDVSPAADCSSYAPPGLVGDTGENAKYLPKLLFKWNWADVAIDQCDSSNSAYVYCDATQFAIETLKKVQTVRQFLQDNSAKLQCPTADQTLTGIDYTVGNADIGIDQVRVSKVNNTDVNIVVTMQNNNNPSVSTTLKVVLKKQSDGSQSQQTQTVSVLSQATAGFSFTGLNSGEKYDYTVTATYANCDSSSCNTISADDSGTNSFTVGLQGAEQCTPYDSTRLGDFIDATEAAGVSLSYPSEAPNKTAFLNTIHFTAHLMRDKYSPDFHHDFDNYAQNISFFNAPSTYTSSTDGLGILFKNFDNFKFVPKFGEAPASGYELPSAGQYVVDLNIAFDNTNWQFFDSGAADVKVKVLLNKSPSETDDVSSPFYSLPLDGLIGTTDGDNGRTGYGVAFSGEVVNINSDSSHQVSTQGIASSTPFDNSANVSVSKDQGFKSVNVDNRGVILNVTKSSIRFAPSYATPLILNVTNSAQEAYAFYNFGINGADTYQGTESNPWWGVGNNCKDFSDRAVTEAFNGKTDRSSLNPTCAPTAGIPGHAYGLEWCDTTQRTGDVFLKTIFYTPQGNANLVNIALANAGAKFISESGAGTNNIGLNGTGKVPNNSSGNDIDSIETIFSLVKQRYVCVSGTGAETKFWWNPTKVLDVLSKQEQSAATSCISQ